MSALVYVVALAAGVWILVDLYIFKFDQHTEKDLIRLSFYWAPLILFGLLGLMAKRMNRVDNHLLFAIIGTLLGIAGLGGIVMLVFLS